MKYALKAWPAFLCGVLMALYFSVLFRYGSNVPLWDDYYDILYFFKTYLEADGGWNKFSTLFWRYVEHRSAPGRLVYLGYYYLFGSLNFFWLNLFGLFFLFALAWMIAQLLLRQQVACKYVILPAHVVAFALLLSMGSWQGSYFATNSIGVVLYSVLFFASFLLLSQRTTITLIGAMILNGVVMVGGLIGLINFLFASFFALSSERPFLQKKIWVVYSLLASLVFFMTYSDYLQIVEFSRSDTLLAIVDNPVGFTRTFFAFIGGLPCSDGNPWWAGALLGLLMVVASVYLLWHCWRRDRQYFFLLSSVLGVMYVLMLAACVGRYLYIGESMAYSSRFKHYQAALLSLIMIGYMQLYPLPRVSFGAVILALAVTVNGYIRFLPQIQELSATAQERMARWVADGSHDSLGIVGVAPYADQILFWAIDKDLYDPYRTSRAVPHLHLPPVVTPQCDVDDQTAIAMDAFVLSEPSSVGARVMLFNKDDHLHIRTLYLCSDEVNYQLDAKEPVSEMAVQKAVLTPGLYRVGFATPEGEHFTLNQTLTVPAQREKRPCTPPDDGGLTFRFGLEVKRAFCDSL